MGRLINNIKELKQMCEINTFDLLKITEEEYNTVSSDINSSSKKKSLAHLVNMAVFQHQRMVRAQFENEPEIIHDSENWLMYSNYEKLNSRRLINFWKNYNLFIGDLVENSEGDSFQKQCFLGVEEPVSLEELFNDYVIEVRSHLNKIISEVYDPIEEVCLN